MYTQWNTCRLPRIILSSKTFLEFLRQRLLSSEDCPVFVRLGTDGLHWTIWDAAVLFQFVGQGVGSGFATVFVLLGDRPFVRRLIYYRCLHVCLQKC
jgi:hypothetical protein